MCKASNKSDGDRGAQRQGPDGRVGSSSDRLVGRASAARPPRIAAAQVAGDFVGSRVAVAGSPAAAAGTPTSDTQHLAHRAIRAKHCEESADEENEGQRIAQGNGVMALFTDNFLNPLNTEEDPESSTDEEEYDSVDKDKRKLWHKNNKIVNGVHNDAYETMPYPIIIDSGAAESVLPPGWCPQAETTKGVESRTYTAANGSTISNQGEKVVSMVTKWGGSMEEYEISSM